MSLGIYKQHTPKFMFSYSLVLKNPATYLLYVSTILT